MQQSNLKYVLTSIGIIVRQSSCGGGSSGGSDIWHFWQSHGVCFCANKWLFGQLACPIIISHLTFTHNANQNRVVHVRTRGLAGAASVGCLAEWLEFLSFDHGESQSLAAVRFLICSFPLMVCSGYGRLSEKWLFPLTDYGDGGCVSWRAGGLVSFEALIEQLTQERA